MSEQDENGSYSVTTLTGGPLTIDDYTEGEGGDIKFMPGKGGTSIKDGVKIPQRDGSIIFYLADETEMVRMDPDGNFYVKGNCVSTDQDVYVAFCTWLTACGLFPEPGASVTEDN